MNSNTTTASLLPTNLPLPQAPQPQQPQQPQQGGLDVPSFIQTARQKGVPDQQTYTYLQQNGLLQQPQQPQETAQLHDTGSFLGNVGNSIGNFVGGVGNAVFHPIDTVKNLGQTAIGLGGQITNATGLTDFSGSNIQHAQALEGFIKQRYGSLDAAKKTAYQDPVGFLADFSALLSGGGAIAGKVGELGDISELSKAGSLASKAGEITNPINIGAKAINNPITRGVTDFAGRQVANLEGAATGAGGSSIKAGMSASVERNPEFIQAARGNTSAPQIIQTAQDALDNLKQSKNTTYQQQLSKVKDVAGEVDYMPAVQKFREELTKNGITVKGETLNFDNARGFQNPSEQAVIQNAYNKVERWGDVPSNNTLYGLDTLKQQLGDFYEQAQGKARPVIASTKNALSDVLKQNPEYKNLVEPYESTSKLIDEMKSGLVSKNPETTLKKLTKAMSQDNEYRQSLIGELNKYTPNGEDIKAQLAGLNMSEWANKSKLFTYGEIGTAITNPHLLPAFIASSPRVVAEFMNALGYSASKIDQGLSFLSKYKAALNATARVNKATSPSPVQQQPKKGVQIKVRVPQTLQHQLQKR